MKFALGCAVRSHKRNGEILITLHSEQHSDEKTNWSLIPATSLLPSSRFELATMPVWS
jgi:hypothetical protein